MADFSAVIISFNVEPYTFDSKEAVIVGSSYNPLFQDSNFRGYIIREPKGHPYSTFEEIEVMLFDMAKDQFPTIVKMTDGGLWFAVKQTDEEVKRRIDLQTKLHEAAIRRAEMVATAASTLQPALAAIPKSWLGLGMPTIDATVSSGGEIIDFSDLKQADDSISHPSYTAPVAPSKPPAAAKNFDIIMMPVLGS